jgi:hypothetical protein
MIAGWRATGYGCDRTSTHHATKCAGTPRASSTPAQCLVAPAKADIPTADLSSLSSSSPIFQKHKNVFPERFGLVGGLIGVSKDVRFSHAGAPEHDVMTVTIGVSRGTVGQSLRQLLAEAGALNHSNTSASTRKAIDCFFDTGFSLPERCRERCAERRPRTSRSKVQFTLFRCMPTISASSASCALRFGRKPYEKPRNSPS